MSTDLCFACAIGESVPNWMKPSAQGCSVARGGRGGAGNGTIRSPELLRRATSRGGDGGATGTGRDKAREGKREAWGGSP